MGWKPIAKNVLPNVGDTVLIWSPDSSHHPSKGFFTGKIWKEGSDKSECHVTNVQSVGPEKCFIDWFITCPDIIYCSNKGFTWACYTKRKKSSAWIIAIWKPGENCNNLYLSNTTLVSLIQPKQPND